MIKSSIIVCARKSGDSFGLEQTLKTNCCLQQDEYQIVEVVGAPSMGAGFNQGIQLAENDVFVFTHTDVEVWAGRRQWELMLQATNEWKAGFVGLAGTPKLNQNGCWWSNDAKCGAVAHRNKGIEYTTSFGPYGQVVVMDGVFLACNRSLLKQLGPWAEDGWHFYDIEMTLRAYLAGYKNYVVSLPVLHGSVGELSSEWETARQKFCLVFQGPFSI